MRGFARLAEVKLVEQDYTITEIRRVGADAAVMSLEARTKWNADFPGVATTWVFDWRWDGTNWRLAELRWLTWAGQDPGGVWDTAVRSR